MDKTSVVTSREQAMIDVWERHVAAEFAAKDVDATMETMTANPFVNHVPVMTGGVGREAVRAFYASYFLTGHPDDTETVPLARTIGENRIVDELIYRCTHSIEMPWILPGIAPTHRRLEFTVVAVVEFEDGLIAGERIHWDQATVLAQLGLVDPAVLPVTTAEASRKALDPDSVPSNGLIERSAR